MTKTRRLSDLFVVGTDVVVDDGQGEPITIWLQKLNPMEHETAMRRAGGARAQVLSGKNEAEITFAHDEATQLGRDGWIEYLVSDTLSRKLPVIEAELAAEEEWADDSYLQGLRDVWETSMRVVLEEFPDAADAIRVKEELDRFQEEYDRRVEGERENLRLDFETRPDEELERKVVDRVVAIRADLAWLSEFRKCEIWLATRCADAHRKRYFESRDEVDELSHPVLLRLFGAYADLNVDPLEGKDSGEIPSSSPSQESPGNPEMVDSSGPEE